MEHYWTKLARSLKKVFGFDDRLVKKVFRFDDYINNNNNIPANLWLDLPEELLLLIFEKCSPFEMFRLLCVCKSWRAFASLWTKSVIGRHPCLLIHSDYKPHCLLVNNQNNRSHLISIPQLKGATCIASSHGWLLLSKRGALFFFHLFTRNVIDLPPFPLPLWKRSERVAAFSAQPNLSNCFICFSNINKTTGFELFLLSLGEQEPQRSRHDLGHIIGSGNRGNMVCGSWYKDKFWFGNKDDVFVSFCPQDKVATPSTPPFGCWKKHSVEWMGYPILSWGDVSISTCGTLVPQVDSRMDSYIVNEWSNPLLSDTCRVKAIWLYPTFSCRT